MLDGALEPRFADHVQCGIAELELEVELGEAFFEALQLDLRDAL